MPCQEQDEELDLLALFPEKSAGLIKYLDGLDVGNNQEQNRGYLIQSLHQAQHIFGYLPRNIQQLVATKLKLHLSEVYGVISFYHYFTDKPVGKFKINVCTGTACFVKGSGAVLDELKRYLNIEEGETSRDKKFSLGGLRCVGACSLAPVVMVNERVYGNVTPKMVPEIINDCK
jgi:NADH:ubiquinone oxidoreductase subunit E